jgi:multicomponent Na+:H+ antiporter subunit B
MTSHSNLLSKSLTIIYPFILLFGVYIVVNGHTSPGGGFQGGAIIASAYISKYLVLPVYDYQLEPFKKIEKIMLLIILLMPITFFVFQMNMHFPELNIPYLVIMNVLIAVKVTCGISVIFFRFVFFETR